MEIFNGIQIESKQQSGILKSLKEMKTTLKIALLCVALAVMTACSAQRRAERQVRKAVSLCPELVQTKAHTIDTTLTAPAFADVATIPMAKVATFDTIYAATEHGTVVVSLCPTDSTLRVGFVAAPRQIRYQDTLRYAQVVVTPKKTTRSNTTASEWILVWLFGGITGLVGCYFLLKKLKRQ